METSFRLKIKKLCMHSDFQKDCANCIYTISTHCLYIIYLLSTHYLGDREPRARHAGEAVQGRAGGDLVQQRQQEGDQRRPERGEQKCR